MHEVFDGEGLCEYFCLSPLIEDTFLDLPENTLLDCKIFDLFVPF